MCLTSGRVKPTYSACDDPGRFADMLLLAVIIR
jgi:hypothetical protein